MISSNRQQAREILREYLEQNPKATSKQLGDLLGVSRQRAHVLKKSIVQPLTAHEVQILILLQKDYSNQQIAETLRQNHHSLKNNLGILFAKLGAHTRYEVVRLATDKGILEKTHQSERGI